MRQFEIFCFHTQNFIKKKELYLFFFFFIRMSANPVERLDESGENSAERRNVLSRSGERTQMCRMAQWAAERLLSSGRSLFTREILPSLFFRSYHETQSMSSVFQMTDVAFQPGLQGLVLMTLSTSQLGQGLTSSTSVAVNSTEHCFFATGLTSLYFPTQGQIKNLQQTCTSTDTFLEPSPFSFRQAFSKARLQRL